MAITFTNDSATISSTEYSLPSDSTSRVAQTDDCILQAFIDFSAMAAGDGYVVKFYEKYDSAGTQRLVEQWSLAGAQSRPMFTTPSFVVGEGWDVTVTKVAGTDRSIAWSLRKVA